MEEFIISNIDELDTFDSYFGTPVIEKDYITIPYINMGLIEEHPLNSHNKLVHINFCFLQIIEPKYISVYNKGVIQNELDSYDDENSRWFGGFFLGEDSDLDAEMEIQAKDVYLIIPSDYKTSSEMWIPDFKEFKGKGNISEKDLLEFLSKTSNIKKINLNLKR